MVEVDPVSVELALETAERHGLHSLEVRGQLHEMRGEQEGARSRPGTAEKDHPGRVEGVLYVRAAEDFVEDREGPFPGRQGLGDLLHPTHLGQKVADSLAQAVFGGEAGDELVAPHWARYAQTPTDFR